MNKETTNNNMVTHYIICKLFIIIFFILGILNLIYVHPVPGLFYLFLSTVYMPLTTNYLSNKFGIIIPLWIKIMVGLVVIWGTLAVGDLMELFEAWLLT